MSPKRSPVVFEHRTMPSRVVAQKGAAVSLAETRETHRAGGCCRSATIAAVPRSHCCYDVTSVYKKVPDDEGEKQQQESKAATSRVECLAQPLVYSQDWRSLLRWKVGEWWADGSYACLAATYLLLLLPRPPLPGQPLQEERGVCGGSAAVHTRHPLPSLGLCFYHD